MFLLVNFKEVILCENLNESRQDFKYQYEGEFRDEGMRKLQERGGSREEEGGGASTGGVGGGCDAKLGILRQFDL